VRPYETAGARDAARIVRRGIFGYCLGYALFYAFLAGVGLFAVGCFAVLFYLAAQS
jgi:hypothetical protein